MNPHAFVYLDSKDDKGVVRSFRVEMGPPYALQRGGWTKRHLEDWRQDHDREHGSRQRRQQYSGIPSDNLDDSGFRAEDGHAMNHGFSIPVDCSNSLRRSAQWRRLPLRARAGDRARVLRSRRSPRSRHRAGLMGASISAPQPIRKDTGKSGPDSAVCRARRMSRCSHGRALLSEYRSSHPELYPPLVGCKAAGGPGFFNAPGFEIVDVPELKSIFILNIAGPHSWRVIYMDGRPHPTGDALTADLSRAFDRSMGRRYAGHRHRRIQREAVACRHHAHDGQIAS